MRFSCGVRGAVLVRFGAVQVQLRRGSGAVGSGPAVGCSGAVAVLLRCGRGAGSRSRCPALLHASVLTDAVRCAVASSGHARCVSQKGGALAPKQVAEGIYFVPIIAKPV